MTRLITILCLAVFAGCGDHIQKIEAQKLQIELLTKDRDYWRTYAESLEKGKPTAAVPHDFETSTAQANITREQLAGIYRRLVELEKRAGIRDAEGNKIPGDTAP